jgi:PPOX class probable F420-dependent enzyme
MATLPNSRQEVSRVPKYSRSAWEQVRQSRFVNLTTVGGEPISRAVRIAMTGGLGYLRMPAEDERLHRLREDDRVEVEVSTQRGAPVGPPLDATARVLGGEEAEQAAALHARRYPERRLPGLRRRREPGDVVYVEITPLRPATSS